MSKNVVTPKSVSFEVALRNLASCLTGRSANQLPRTQEGIVQFMAENVPTPDEMAETITQKVLARLEAAAPDALGGTPTPGETEKLNTEAPVADGKPKRGSKANTAK